METVTYEGESGLAAIVRALDNLRALLAGSMVTGEQAASMLGCINLHLAETVGIEGDMAQHLQDCGGLLCPQCRGFVGFVSNLSADCPHCGKRFFAPVGSKAERP